MDGNENKRELRTPEAALLRTTSSELNTATKSYCDNSDEHQTKGHTNRKTKSKEAGRQAEAGIVAMPDTKFESKPISKRINKLIFKQMSMVSS